MDLTSEENTWLSSVLPEGSMPVGYVASIDYITADGEPFTITCMQIDDLGVAKALGMVELSKMDLMGKYRCGPFDPWYKTHDQPPEDD